MLQKHVETGCVNVPLRSVNLKPYACTTKIDLYLTASQAVNRYLWNIKSPFSKEIFLEFSQILVLAQAFQKNRLPNVNQYLTHRQYELVVLLSTVCH